MKKLALTFAFILSFGFAHAQYDNWAVGFKLGEPTGINIRKYFNNIHALDVTIGLMAESCPTTVSTEGTKEFTKTPAFPCKCITYGTRRYSIPKLCMFTMDWVDRSTAADLIQNA